MLDKKNKNGSTALMLAVEKGHVDVVARLLQGGADSNVKTRNGLTALMSAARTGNVDAVKHLLLGGADPNIQTQDGWTALMFAIDRGHDHVMPHLLLGGVKPNIKSNDGETAMMKASWNGLVDNVMPSQLMLGSGVDETQDETELIWAVKEGSNIYWAREESYQNERN